MLELNHSCRIISTCSKAWANGTCFLFLDQFRQRVVVMDENNQITAIRLERETIA